MSLNDHSRLCRLGVELCLAATFVLFGACPWAVAQGGRGGFQQSVGGVFIGADGLLRNATVDERGKLRREFEKAMQAVPGDLAKPSPLRKVSLRRLEAAIVAARQAGKPLPDDIRYLAGLQRIRYVFAAPSQQDVILAGPAEGWRVGPQGEALGAVNGQPVMLLDDLLTALRTANTARDGGISCSIDPTADGINRFMVAAGLASMTYTDDRETADQKVGAMEEALGPQNITVTGVPQDSHFARVLVAADYRMKCLGMGLEPAPIKGFPSYLSTLKSTRSVQNMMPRWWLAMNYGGVLAAPDGMAFEIKGAGVKCQVEEEFLNQQGQRQGTGTASPGMKRWADMMTNRYLELAAKESIFGHLLNCMDLAVVAALITKEHLAEKANLSVPMLLSAADLPTEQFQVPKQVASQASLLRRSGGWIISVSGGVLFDSWGLLAKTEPSEQVAAVVTASENAPADGAWWWD